MLYVTLRNDGRMPLRMPTSETIRREIAELAAEYLQKPASALMSLLGPVEPIGTGDRAGGWRLTHYSGSPDEHAAIERAAGTVQRRHPLVRPD